MKRESSKNNGRNNAKVQPETGIIVVSSGEEMGIYRFESSAQRKNILKMNAENRCREFSSDEYERAEEYLQRAVDEAEARKYPLGYIAVRSGQFKGVYPYISQEERLKHMNRYHKYEIQDFPHFHFRYMAEEWNGEGPVVSPMSGNDEISRLLNREIGAKNPAGAADKVRSEHYEHDHDALMKFIKREHVRPHIGCHEVLEKIFESGAPERFTGVIKYTDHSNLVFETLECRTGTEHDVCIYNTEFISDIKAGQTVSFTAEVYEYIKDNGYIDYGLYREFDLEIIYS